ncbi:hypothetical protein M2D63_011250 [Pseudomonas sp. BJa5]|uniref:hypothetical protein n=1 Tax=Pseudomonas sp. BJa5 TaxID=2936270 RepID=UPI00255A0924|nr:hypothetical protein [Pseudomonas sp. BGr12]MDL2421691.1 hypothetical protein [Pseudomonas sp. BGr12]
MTSARSINLHRAARKGCREDTIMCNCTSDFLVKHVRILGQRQPDDLYNQLIQRDLEVPVEAMLILNQKIDNTREAVTHRAGITLQARVEEFGHQYPNTVMFMDLATLQQLCTSLNPLQRSKRDFDCRVRIPWIVTWTGTNTYEVVQNAAGFGASTDAEGLCNHYRLPLKDGHSNTSNWKATGL